MISHSVWTLMYSDKSSICLLCAGPLGRGGELLSRHIFARFSLKSE